MLEFPGATEMALTYGTKPSAFVGRGVFTMLHDTFVLVASLMFVERHRFCAPRKSVLLVTGSIAIGGMKRIVGELLLKLQLASVMPKQMYWLAFAGGEA